MRTFNLFPSFLPPMNAAHVPNNGLIYAVWDVLDGFQCLCGDLCSETVQCSFSTLPLPGSNVMNKEMF